MCDADARLGQLPLAGERVELVGLAGDLRLEAAALGMGTNLFRGELLL